MDARSQNQLFIVRDMVGGMQEAFENVLMRLRAIESRGGQALLTNLAPNASFERWEYGLGPFTADDSLINASWRLRHGGLASVSATRSTTADVASLYSVAITYSHASSHYARLTHTMIGYVPTEDRPLSFAARVLYDAVGGTIKAFISTDGGATRTYGVTLASSSVWQTALVAIDMPAGAGVVIVGVEITGATGVAYIDNATLIDTFGGADYRIGSAFHEQLTSGFLELGQIATPVAAEADRGYLYIKDLVGVSTPFFMSDTGVDSNLLLGSGGVTLGMLDDYVPYIGATGDVNLGLNDLYVRNIYSSTFGINILGRDPVLDGDEGGYVSIRGGNGWNADAGWVKIQGGYAGDTGYRGGDVFIIAGTGETEGDRGKVLIGAYHGFDGFEASLQTDLLTAERTFDFPDQSGTIALLSDIGGGGPFVPYTGATGSVDLGTHDLSLANLYGTNAGGMLVRAAAGAPGADLTIESGAGNATGAASGDLFLRGGTNSAGTPGNASGGSVFIVGGVPTGSGVAGYVSIAGGSNPAGDGNIVDIVGGESTGGAGGQVSLYGGTALSTGEDGGDVYLVGGSAATAAQHGHVVIYAGGTGNAFLQTDLLTGDRTFDFPNTSGTLALLSDIGGGGPFVPYTGATGNVTLGTHNLLVANITGTDASGMLVQALGGAPGAYLQMQGGDGTATGDAGGDLYLLGGYNTAGTPGDADGGNIAIQAGVPFGTGTAGHVNIEGGNNNGGAGGYIQFTAGYGVGGNGADMYFQAGASIGGTRGGNVYFAPGVGTGGATNGLFQIQTQSPGIAGLQTQLLTVDQTFDFPNQSGTLALLSDIAGAFVPYSGATGLVDISPYNLWVYDIVGTRAGAMEIHSADGNPGAYLSLYGGSGTATNAAGGAVYIAGGSNTAGTPGNADGGNVELDGGAATGSGTPGSISIGTQSVGYARLRTDLLTTVNRVFQFPDQAGTFALLTDIPAGVTPAALTKTDDTNVTLALGGTPATALLQAASLTLGWTGTLAIARGGTGASSAGAARTALGIVPGTDVQAYDATLTAFAAYNTNGYLVQTAADTFVGRTITGTANRLGVTNGDGVAGNTVLDISATYVGQASITTLGTITTGVWTGTTIAVLNGGTGATTVGGARTNLGLVIGTDVQAYNANLAAIAGLTSAANKGLTFTGAGTAAVYDLSAFALTFLDDGSAAAVQTTLGLAIGTNVQAYDTDLATIASLTATTDNFMVAVSSAWASRTPAQVRTTLGLVVGTNVQAYDAELAALAGLTSAADALPYFTGAGTATVTTLTSFARTVLDDVDATAARATLGLVLGTNVQAYDATLASIAALGTAADKLAYTTGVDTWAEAPITAFGRSLIDDADATAGRTTLGLGTIATQNANAVAITGGTLAGMTSIASVTMATSSTITVMTTTVIGSSVTLTGGILSVTYDGENVLRRDTAGTTPSSTTTILSLQNRDITDGNLIGVRFLATDTGATSRNTAFVYARVDTHGASSTTSALVFATANASATPATRLVVGASGAGIDVTGASTFSSTLAVTGALTLTVPLAIAQGGTGGTTQATARTGLGLVIGTDVQAYDADLAAIAGLTSAADKGIYFTGSGTAGVFDLSTFMRTVLDDTTAAAARTTLGVDTGAVAFTFGDGTNAIIAASEPDQILRFPYAVTITKVSLLADASGSIVVDLWVDTYANYPPTASPDSITASAKPTLSSANKSEDSTLTGWTKTIAAGSVMKAHVDSASTVKTVLLTIEFIRT